MKATGSKDIFPGYKQTDIKDDRAAQTAGSWDPNNPNAAHPWAPGSQQKRKRDDGAATVALERRLVNSKRLMLLRRTVDDFSRQQVQKVERRGPAVSDMDIDYRLGGINARHVGLATVKIPSLDLGVVGA